MTSTGRDGRIVLVTSESSFHLPNILDLTVAVEFSTIDSSFEHPVIIMIDNDAKRMKYIIFFILL